MRSLTPFHAVHHASDICEPGLLRLLLVTLEILRALTAECRRDLTLFSGGVVNSIDISLSCLPSDLEVIARAASTVGKS